MVIINQSVRQVSLRSLLYLLRRAIKCALYASEILICEYESPNLRGVNPSEQDINAMKRSLN